MNCISVYSVAYTRKATCLNINDNDNNRIKRILCVGDMGC